jgi:hypothetical protein
MVNRKKIATNNNPEAFVPLSIISVTNVTAPMVNTTHAPYREIHVKILRREAIVATLNKRLMAPVVANQKTDQNRTTW